MRNQRLYIDTSVIGGCFDTEFDCVELQRKIRDEFIEEADNDFDKLINLLKIKVGESEINKRLLERNKKQLTTV